MSGNIRIFVFLILFGLSRASLHKDSPGPHYDCSYCQPEQIHIAFGENTNDIVVTWSTFNDSIKSIVEYGEKVMDREAHGHAKQFIDGGREHRSQWIHTVKLTGLKFNTKYVYHCGSEFGWSEIFSFKTPPEGENWVVRAAIYGDMGSENAHSLSYLQDEAERDHFDLILHVGDFAYDMDTDNARVGDEFMRQIQPLAANIPYMTCPGNHEEKYNFSNYANRFTMPGRDSSLYYSFDLGPVHFVSISTEVYYFLQYGAKLVVHQYEWLRKDLENANKPENRQRRPWIILFGHRPMYCSNSNDIDCSFEYTRRGFFGYMGLEPLLMKYGVDVVIWAHEHSYERTWPLYDNKVYNGSLNQPYTNPRAPIHVITGSAGCKEDTDKFIKNTPAWSAFRSSDYGYTRFVAHNKTHIYFEQVDVDLKETYDNDIIRYDRGLLVRNVPNDEDQRMWLKLVEHNSTFRAPIHIITGSAGCKEGRDHFRHTPFDWSAFHSQDFGYTKMKVYNKTHIEMEQVSVDLDGEVIDSFWIIKNGKLRFDYIKY